MQAILLTSVFVLGSIAAIPSSITAYNAPGRIEQLEVIDMSVPAIIRRSALKYGADEEVMKRIIKCESSNIEDIQSLHKYKHDHPEWDVKKGDYERSFGLVQIHLPSHPSITYEQAIDPEFATDFLAKNLVAGRGSLWSCWKQI